MSLPAGQILIGTILLEVNRWGNPKTPTYEVSAWLDRFRQAGFDGMELWEYHATLCSASERKKLFAADFPASIFNSYCDFDDGSERARRQAAEMISQLGCAKVKFNVGKDPALRETYLKNLREWRRLVPEFCVLSCECHPGTIVEGPEAARAFFDDLDMDGWEVMVHCFLPDTDGTAKWFELFGENLGHAHVQMRDSERKVMLLREDPERVRKALKVMETGGFKGSFTIEFAKGTREPGENMDDLWLAAQSDLAFLRSHLP